MNARLFSFQILLISAVFAQQFSVDWASFNYDHGLASVEIYYSCPYSILQYQTKKDTVFAPYGISFFLKSVEGPDSLVEIINRRAILPSFENAHLRDMKLVDGFGFFASPGKYWFNLAIYESLPIAFYHDTIIVPNFSRAPSISDIELASSATVDTTSGKFTKGRFRIIPNPEKSFGQAYEFIYAYIEGYNLVDDTSTYELSYQILNATQKIIKSYPSEIKKKTGRNFAYTFALNTKGLAPGNYLLNVTLKDLSNNNYTSTEKAFSITAKTEVEKTMTSAPSYIDTIYNAQEIRFFATPTELKQYDNLTEAGKKEFLRKFWLKHNLAEHIKRLKHVDNKYSIGRILGRDTDRGRIYVKYGSPDEITIHSMIEHAKPHEHWYYYSNGTQYIFTDIYSNSNFELIYSNNPSERNHSNWEKYIDPLELNEINQ